MTSIDASQACPPCEEEITIAIKIKIKIKDGVVSCCGRAIKNIAFAFLGAFCTHNVRILSQPWQMGFGEARPPTAALACPEGSRRFALCDANSYLRAGQFVGAATAFIITLDFKLFK